MDQTGEKSEQKRLPKESLRTQTKHTLLVAVLYFIIYILFTTLVKLAVPWKTIVILFLLPVIGIVSRGRFRRCFLAALGIAILVVVAWLFIPEATDGQWRPKGLSRETYLSGMDPKAVLAENAAVEYESVLDSQDWAALRKRQVALDPNLPPGIYWNRTDCPEWARFVDEQEPYLERIRKASRLSDCHFSIPYSVEGLQTISQRDFAFFVLWKFLASSANRDIGEGRIEEGLDRYWTFVRFGRHLCHDGNPEFVTLGRALEGAGYRRLAAAVMADRLSEDQVQKLEEALSGEGEGLEQAWTREAASQLFFTKDLYGRIYLTRGDALRFNLYAFTGPTQRFRPESWEHDSAYWNGFRSRLGCVVKWVLAPPDLETIYGLVDSAFEPVVGKASGTQQPDWSGESRTQFQKLVDLFRGVRYETEGSKKNGTLRPKFWADRFIDFRDDIANAAISHWYQYEFFAARFKEGQTQKNGCRILCALWRYRRLHGDWPASLDELKALIPSSVLIDPCNGGDYVYRVTGNQFRLYSRGNNGKDDEGRRDSPQDPRKLLTLCNQKELLKALRMELDDVVLWPHEYHKKALDLEYLLDPLLRP
jgi:hypothetical protein